LLYYCAQQIFASWDASQGSGLDNDQWVASTAMFTNVILVVTIRCMLDTCTWNWLTFLFFFGSVISWFLFMAIYSSIVSITPDMFGVAGVLFFRRTTGYWLCSCPQYAISQMLHFVMFVASITRSLVTLLLKLTVWSPQRESRHLMHPRTLARTLNWSPNHSRQQQSLEQGAWTKILKTICCVHSTSPHLTNLC